MDLKLTFVLTLLYRFLSLVGADVSYGHLYHIYETLCPIDPQTDSGNMNAEEECVLWCNELPNCYLVSPVWRGNHFKCFQHEAVDGELADSDYEQCNICKSFLHC